MLCWMCGHTRKDNIRNEDIRCKVGVAEIEGKMRGKSVSVVWTCETKAYKRSGYKMRLRDRGSKQKG